MDLFDELVKRGINPELIKQFINTISAEEDELDESMVEPEAEQLSSIVDDIELPSDREKKKVVLDLGEIETVSYYKPVTTMVIDGKDEELPDSGPRYVKEIIPEAYIPLFDFEEWNPVQRLVVEKLWKTDDNYLIATDTGTGKTAMAYVAIVKELKRIRTLGIKGKIVYIAPMKAIVNDKFHDLTKDELKDLISVEMVTGDSRELEYNPIKVQGADIIITTPEKFDSVMGKWWWKVYEWTRDIRLIIIDEVHELGSKDRGGVIDSLIARIRLFNPNIRIIALSATVPNVEEIAKWIDAKILKSTWRPVPLEIQIKEYDWDYYYRMLETIQDMVHAEVLEALKRKKQSLIFIMSRRQVQTMAENLAQTLPTDVDWEWYARKVDDIKNASLRETLSRGIGFHHAGLSYRDRLIVEYGFRYGKFPVLLATPTLAYGVDLPAHQVIIATPFVFDGIEGWRLLDISTIQQMMGRAGRPRYDKKGYVRILVPHRYLDELISNLAKPRDIKSRLGDVILESVNRLIFSKVARRKSEIMKWAYHTLLYAQNPNTLELVEKSIRWLIDNGFIVAEPLTRKVEKQDGKIFDGFKRYDIEQYDWEYECTRKGEICATWYIAAETVNLLYKTTHLIERPEDILALMTHSKELSSIVVRKNEEAFYLNHRLLVGRDELEVKRKQKIYTVLYQLLFIPKEKWELNIAKNDVNVIVEQAIRIALAMSEIYKIASPNEDFSLMAKTIGDCLQYGILYSEKDLVDLLKIKWVGEKTAKILKDAGIMNAEDIIAIGEQGLKELGIRNKSRIIEAAYEVLAREKAKEGKIVDYVPKKPIDKIAKDIRDSTRKVTEGLDIVGKPRKRGKVSKKEKLVQKILKSANIDDIISSLSTIVDKLEKKIEVKGELPEDELQELVKEIGIPSTGTELIELSSNIEKGEKGLPEHMVEPLKSREFEDKPIDKVEIKQPSLGEAIGDLSVEEIFKRIEEEKLRKVEEYAEKVEKQQLNMDEFVSDIISELDKEALRIENEKHKVEAMISSSLKNADSILDNILNQDKEETIKTKETAETIEIKEPTETKEVIETKEITETKAEEDKEKQETDTSELDKLIEDLL